VYGILRAYSIPVADWKIAKNAAEAAKAAQEIGFPVVVKADSEAVAHKREMGGVAMNLRDEGTLCETLKKMGKRYQASDLKFLVQKYLAGGKEVIVSAKADDEVGHLIMFGIGGIYVEIFRNAAFKLPPVNDVEAEEMISSLERAPLLRGVRGEGGVYEKN
jgi:acetyltransferase